MSDTDRVKVYPSGLVETDVMPGKGMGECIEHLEQEDAPLALFDAAHEIADLQRQLTNVKAEAAVMERAAEDVGAAWTDRAERAERALAEANASAAAMRRALEILDPRNATECYDLIAEAFRRKTGLLAPGKSIPLAMGGYGPEDEERRHREWRPFANRWHEDFFAEALKPTAGADLLAELERLKLEAAGLRDQIRLCRATEYRAERDEALAALNGAKQLAAALESKTKQLMEERDNYLRCANELKARLRRLDEAAFGVACGELAENAERRAVEAENALAAARAELAETRAKLEAAENWRCIGPDAPHGNCRLADFEEMCVSCQAHDMDESLAAARAEISRLQNHNKFLSDGRDIEEKAHLQAAAFAEEMKQREAAARAELEKQRLRADTLWKIVADNQNAAGVVEDTEKALDQLDRELDDLCEKLSTSETERERQAIARQQQAESALAAARAERDKEVDVAIARTREWMAQEGWVPPDEHRAVVERWTGIAKMRAETIDAAREALGLSPSGSRHDLADAVKKLQSSEAAARAELEAIKAALLAADERSADVSPVEAVQVIASGRAAARAEVERLKAARRTRGGICECEESPGVFGCGLPCACRCHELQREVERLKAELAKPESAEQVRARIGFGETAKPPKEMDWHLEPDEVKP